MSCKTLLDNPSTPVTSIHADTVYYEMLSTIFETNLYSFEMIESEIMTFNFNITAFTNSLELILTLFKIDSNEEYIEIGSSYIDQVVNTIDYDITPGQYAYCLTSSHTPMTYEMMLEFTEFPYIVFPTATASDGSNLSVDDFGGNIGFCDSVIVYSIIAGKLPPNFNMGNNGVIQGLLPELDCVTNDANFKGLLAPIAEFQVEFVYGSHAYIYNYGPDDFVAFTGCNVDFDLKLNRHADQDFPMQHGIYSDCELETYRENEFYHGIEADLILTTYPLKKTDGDNYNITDEIPPSFSLFNNNQGDDFYYPTQVEWEFTVRAAFDEDKSQYKDRTFKICLSNNWDTDQATFANAFDDFETEVFTEEDLLNVNSRLEVSNISVDTDLEPIPKQSIDKAAEFDEIIRLALLDVQDLEVNETELGIELCDPCIVEESPRIREIDISGLCYCEPNDELVEVEPELVNDIEINCAEDFVISMFTEMACFPIEPCGIPTVYIRAAKHANHANSIELKSQCDDTCD